MSTVQEKFQEVTTSFTEIEGWQERNHATNGDNTTDWHPPSKLSTEALQQPEHVGKVIKFSQDVFNGDFFTRTRMGACLVHLREQCMGIASNEVLMSYEKTTLPLQRDIQVLTAKVKGICAIRDDYPDRKGLLKELKALSLRVSNLFTEVRAELVKEMESPLAKDSRVEEKVIIELNKDFQAPVGAADGRSHKKYLEKIAQMEADGKILEGVTQEECWEWKGRVSALDRLWNQTLYAAHALHCLAHTIDPIMERLDDVEFLRKVKAAADAAEPVKSDVQDGAAFILKIMT